MADASTGSSIRWSWLQREFESEIFDERRAPGDRDTERAAFARAFDPTGIEKTIVQRRSERAREVRALLGPIDALPSKVTSLHPYVGGIDAELGKETAAGAGQTVISRSIGHDRAPREQRIGKSDS